MLVYGLLALTCPFISTTGVVYISQFIFCLLLHARNSFAITTILPCPNNHIKMNFKIISVNAF